MITALGKRLRKLRIDKGLLLNDMAISLGVSSAQLSAMELGKRTIQPQLADKIASTYNEISMQEVERLIRISQSSIKINLTQGNERQREVVIMFARMFTELSDEQIKSIHEIVK